MKRRANLTQLMAIVALLALGLGMMKAATEWLARLVVISTAAGLLVATLGVIVRPRRRRAAWIGLALFGWCYLATAALVPVLIKITEDRADSDLWQLWQLDGAVQALAAQFHPEPSASVDPFPNDSIAPDPATGGRFKINNNRRILMTPDEMPLQIAFEAQNAANITKIRARRLSLAIGLAIQGLAFALIGGAAGQALGNRAEETGSSPEAVSTTLAG